MASADDNDFEPAPAAVSVQLDGTTARFVAHYKLSIEGPSWSLGGYEFVTPPTGLVTDATVKLGDEPARRLLLADSDTASAALEALGTAPSSDDRGWVFQLAHLTQDMISLAYAVPAHSTVDLTLTVSAPTCFVGDTRFVPIPSSWEDRIKGGLVRDDGETCEAGSTFNQVAWIAFPTHEVSARRSGERFDFSAGEAHAGAQSFARVELDLAARLGDVPDDLATAIVVDVSRSMTGSDLELAHNAVGAYLRAAPSSQVQLIGFARTPTALLAQWTNATDARPAVDAAFPNIVQKNGSNLDAALASAKTWLDKVGGTKRVILITDSLLSNRLLAMPMADLRAKVGGALVQVIDVNNAADPFQRDDDLPLAHLALDSGGIAVHASYQGPDDADATLLARPITVDHLRITAPGWDRVEPGFARACPEDGDGVVGEGERCLFWAEGQVAGAPITVEGYVWGRRFTRVLVPNAGASLEVARELVALEFDADNVELQRAAFAIDKVWSMSARWGGDGGYDDVGSGGLGISGGVSGCCGPDAIGTVRGVSVLGMKGTFLTLEQQLAPALAACKIEHAAISVELTFNEIVDVTTDNHCVAEHVWDIALNLEHPIAHETRRVSL